MDIATVEAAITGIKFAKDAVQATLGYKIEKATRSQMTEVLEKLGTAHDTIFKMREELFRLQSENDRLRQDLAARDEWNAVKAQYRRNETPGGAVVYESSGPPKHYACPVCFAKGSVQILQDRRMITGVFDCPNCKAEFPVNPRKAVPISVSKTRQIIGDW